MASARKKIVKEAGAAPDELEEQVAQALFDLEATSADLKAELRDLYIAGAAEIDVSPSRKAILVRVPFRLLRAFRKIQVRRGGGAGEEVLALDPRATRAPAPLPAF